MNDTRQAKVRSLCSDRSLWSRCLVLMVWSVTILWLSLISNPPQVPGALGWDKLQHALAYGLLALLTSRFLAQWLKQAGGRVLGLSALCVVLYGVAMELLQLSVETGRVAEPLDVFADAVGAAVVCVILSHNRMVKFYQPKV